MRKLIILLMISILSLMITACKKEKQLSFEELVGENTGVYYEIFVRSYADSNGDGIGDLEGIISKLDYIKDLGVKGIWLTPIFESKSYHGYDVEDYKDINPKFGTEYDFNELIDEAHKRNIKVILDIPFNHTSNKHLWFLQALDVNSSYHDYYTWINESDPRYSASNIWHYNSQNKLYYAGIFSNEMPDLNMENPKVREEIISIAKYWLSKGIDGFRVDAALHQYGENEYKSDINTMSANIKWWKEFRDALKGEYPNAYLVGEVWESSMIGAPFYSGFDSIFNFDISDLIIGSLNSYDKNYAKNIIKKHEDFKFYNKDFIDAPFLSNHDGNNQSIKARIASTLSGNINKLKLAAEMLLTLPGNPFIYYGEEIGMEGVVTGAPDYDMPLRSPMKWSKSGKNLDTTWYEKNQYNEKVLAVEDQLLNSNSLLNHYKSLISLRNNSLALYEGDMYYFAVGTRNFQSFVRYFNKKGERDAVLVVHNVSNDDLEVTFLNSAKLEIIYQSQGNDYKNNNQINGLSTVIFQIPEKLIDEYIKE